MTSGPTVKVLYFTSTPVDRADNGGSIICRYHIERFASCGFEVHAATLASSDEQAQAAQVFFASLKVTHHRIVDRAGRLPTPFERRWHPTWRWPFLLESEALQNTSTDQQFEQLRKRLQPDVIVVDYLLSALFIRSTYMTSAKIITISFNNEARFHAEMRKAGRLRQGISPSVMSQFRVSHFERHVHRSSDAIVVLSEGDLPRDRRIRERTSVIAPILDQSSNPWKFSGTKELFFVGNCAHHPNFLATKWLAEGFAPELAVYCPEARIRIVGTSDEQADRSWRRSNIEFMGICDQQTLDRMFQFSDLFIAPIANAFGAKLKVMQSISGGTPMIATRGALSAVAFKSVIPQFSLDDPGAAAKLAAEFLRDPLKLQGLSRAMADRHSAELKMRDGQWRALVEKIVYQPSLRPKRTAVITKCQRAVWNPWFDTSRPWPKRIEVAIEEPQGVKTRGMFPREQFNGEPLRWSGELVEVEVNLNKKTLPSSVRLQFHGISPPEGVAFRLFSQGYLLYHGRVNGALVEKNVDLPDLGTSSYLRLRLEVDGWMPQGESRKLGVAIKSIALCR